MYMPYTSYHISGLVSTEFVTLSDSKSLYTVFLRLMIIVEFLYLYLFLKKTTVYGFVGIIFCSLLLFVFFVNVASSCNYTHVIQTPSNPTFYEVKLG